MDESKISIMLHPVRLRILQCLAGNTTQTVQQMSESIPDVPQATLYRHLSKLLEAGILAVVKENQVRGTVEKVYSLSANAAETTGEEFLKATKEEHIKYFFTFLMNLLGDFEKYVNKSDYDMVKDGFGFSQAFLYTNDEEFAEMAKAIGEAVYKVAGNRPGNGRKARTLATIIIPQNVSDDNEPEKGS